MGHTATFTTGGERDNKFTLIRAKGEISGSFFSLIRRLELGDLRSFVKVDAEFKHIINYKKSSLAFRAYIGAGWLYGRSDTGQGKIVRETSLPFYKAFFAGGPYSMRAWPIRRLGPGSSDIYDRPDSALDRFGNAQFEANFEYRFTLATIAGIKLHSALFFDIGNIWGKEFDKDNNPVPEASFAFDR